ncbi:cAMP responsive element modulator b [Oryzias melastigma]|uniref:cAMP responsive element modulator b n=1 Tax=Oryzias melastigma TaxID=30732 RepID=UPI00168CD1AC|nr:cAMP responsive element modulator b [Oryzias melastigma]
MEKDLSATFSLPAVLSGQLLEQHREALATEIKTSFNLLDSKLDQTRLTVEDHDQRVSSLELASEDLNQRVTDLEETCTILREANAKLKAKVTELEGRSRRQNVRILGVPESTEGGSPSKFFSNLLCEVFGAEILPTPPEIDRAHRSLAAEPAAGQSPRLVILRLHRFQTKELIVREARRLGMLELRGKPIRVVEDYSPEVANQRAEYRAVMTELYNRGLKPALLYPARLRVTLRNGDKKWIGSVDEANKYISNLPRTTDSS